MTSHSRRLEVPKEVWPGLFVAAATLCIVLTTSETIYVTAPLAAALTTSLAFVWILWRRRQAMVPWFELGAVYLAAVTLYTVYPLIGYLAIGQQYTLTNDNRLTAMQPGAAEIGRVGWLYVCHLAAFAVVYLRARGRLLIRPTRLRQPTRPVLLAAVVVYAAIEGFGLLLSVLYETSASTYLETYLAARRLPLLVAQLLNHLSGIKYVLALILLAAMFSQYERYRPVILGWLLLVGAITMARLGNRTELVMLLMASTMMYHTLVRPLPPKVIVMMGGAGLVGFLALGALRGGVTGVGALTEFNPFVYGSEFESLFANAAHLNRGKEYFGELPLSFYLADLAALVPQQLAPFTKIDRASWYVNTFFPGYAALGGGFAFGTIAEAIFLGGWMGALALGAALGFCFARIHRFYARHPNRFWVFVFYVWVATLSYQSFRNTTFALLVLFLYRFLPAVLVVNLIGQSVRRVRRTSRSATVPVAVKA